MRALTVQPEIAASARIENVPEPNIADGSILVETIAVGVCGTDIDIVNGEYGSAPRGENRLVLGHESLGRVLEAPHGSGFRPGELLVGIVRRPDPQPCTNCAIGEWDMCRNGLYTERGIKGLHGYCADRYRIEPEFAVKVDPALDYLGVLLEPASVLAKAWEHIEHIGARSRWKPRRLLVTGAGPIGLLAALMGRQRGLEVRVLDQVDDGPKPELARLLGAVYCASNVEHAGEDVDIVIECTGVPQIVLGVLSQSAPGRIVCLTGVSCTKRKLTVDLGGLNRSMVLDNNVVFGSVNANRRHYELAAESLRGADRTWLAGLITRRVPLEKWPEALERRSHDVKTVINIAA